jgi:hypothetical protein
MKTRNPKWIAVAALIAATAGSICNAEEPQLNLQGKSITVYPVVLGRSDKPDDADTIKFGVRVAEVVGLGLEQHGMHPEISDETPEAIASEDSLIQMEQKLQAFVTENKPDTDYTLFTRFLIKPAGRGPAVARICAAITDAAGQVLWSKEITELPEGRGSSPLGACMLLGNAVRSASDLEEPDPENAPYGPIAQLMDQRNGLSPKPERDAMARRFEAAQASFATSTLSVYPFRIWETEAGSVEGGEALVAKLTAAGLFLASATEEDTRLVATRDPDQPSQMKIMWDTARDFRAYLREHPADTNYALLVDVTVPVHHVHLVLCEGSGEWVTASLMNSHHPEFKELDPETLEDAITLAFQRLKMIVSAE